MNYRLHATFPLGRERAYLTLGSRKHVDAIGHRPSSRFTSSHGDGGLPQDFRLRPRRDAMRTTSCDCHGSAYRTRGDRASHPDHRALVQCHQGKRRPISVSTAAQQYRLATPNPSSRRDETAFTYEQREPCSSHHGSGSH